jgi:hypothetical protein
MSEFITNGELRLESERLCDENERLKGENAKMREQMERLVTLLRVDYDIEASWDGLRKVWSISLTKDVCLMRDIACKAEAENAKLRELLADTLIDPRDYCAKYGIDYDGWDSANDDIDRRMRELGIEVSDV